MKKWINHFTEHPEAKINLLCFPSAGGSSTYFAQWIKYFSDEINIWPVQYPMRDNRLQEPLPDSFVSMAEQMALESEELFTEPFALLGHCSGSLLAFELAQQVRRLYDKHPERLIVSASVAPKHSLLKSTKHLPDDVFFKYYNFPEEMLTANTALLSYFLPVIRADFTMCEKYRYQEQAPLHCPITAFAGDDDWAAKPITLAEDWREMSTNPEFMLQVYPGDHFYFDRHREEICQIIAEQLLQRR